MAVPKINTDEPVRTTTSRRQVWQYTYVARKGQGAIGWADRPGGSVEFYTNAQGYLVTVDGEGGWYTHSKIAVENFDVLEAIAGTDTPEFRAEQHAKIQAEVETHPLFGSF